MKYKRAVKILKVRWALLSNKKSLLPELPIKPEFESLLTDFHKVEQIPYRGDFDWKLLVIDQPDTEVCLHVCDGMTIAVGNLSNLTKQARDLRYSLFGNEGLLFRQTLKLLEGDKTPKKRYTKEDWLKEAKAFLEKIKSKRKSDSVLSGF